MQTENHEIRPLRWISNNVLAFATLSGVVLYGLLRFSYGLYYAEFGVTPEEIGLGYFEILAQSVLGALILITGTTTLMAVYIIGASTYLKQIRHLTSSFEAIAKNLGQTLEIVGSAQARALTQMSAVLVESMVALARVLLGQERKTKASQNESEPDEAPSTVIEPSKVIPHQENSQRKSEEVAESEPPEGSRESPDPVKQAAKLGNALFVLYLVVTVISLGVVLPNVAADRAAEVRHGEPAESMTLGPITILYLRGDPAHVTWTREATRSDLPISANDCFLYLGQEDGVAVLFDPEEQETVRLPLQNSIVRTLPWQLNAGLEESC